VVDDRGGTERGARAAGPETVRELEILAARLRKIFVEPADGLEELAANREIRGPVTIAAQILDVAAEDARPLVERDNLPLDDIERASGDFGSNRLQPPGVGSQSSSTKINHSPAARLAPWLRLAAGPRRGPA
jgi:hypothetical protein